MGLWHDGGVVGFGISGVGGEWRAMARDRAHVPDQRVQTRV